MKIVWNKVTWYSKVAAVVIYVGTFAIAFWLGRMYEAQHVDYQFQRGDDGWTSAPLETTNPGAH